MIKCVIVEDEPLFSKNLQQLLKKADVTLQVKAVCADIDSACTAIKKHQPDLVFLDIYLNGNEQGGFDLLNMFKIIPFDVIFTTAFVDQNIQQIRACGLDYIMKPYMEDELSDAIEKFNRKKFGAIRAEQLQTLLRNLEVQDIDEHIVSFYAGNDNIVVKVKDIICCHGVDMTTHFFIRDYDKPNVLKKVTLSKGIGKVAEILAAYGIIKIHRSYLVNHKHVANYSTKSVKLREFAKTPIGYSRELPVSDGYRSDFQRLMGKL
ncbi:MAG: response regulator transcription factor [Flavipsychrobacter sp.]